MIIFLKIRKATGSNENVVNLKNYQIEVYVYLVLKEKVSVYTYKLKVFEGQFIM